MFGFGSKKPKENKGSVFPFTLKGKINDLPFEAPFMSVNAVDTYCEDLVHAFKRFNISVDIVVVDQDGAEVGKVQASPRPIQ